MKTDSAASGQQFRFAAKTGTFQLGAKKVKVSDPYIADDIQTAISYDNHDVLAQIWARLNTTGAGQ